MASTHPNTTTLPARTAFLRNAARQDVATGMGLAKLAMWYASEDIPFDASVAALEARAAGDPTAVRVAYDCLAFGTFAPSPHSQVLALFMVNELRCRVERASRPKRGLRGHLAAARDRLARRRRIPG